MVLSSSRTNFPALPPTENLENYTVIVELSKLTVLYRIDLDKVITIATHPRVWDSFHVSSFKMSNCLLNLQQCCGKADVEIELFYRNLAGDSSLSMGYYPNSPIKLYQIRASKNGAFTL